MLVAVTVTGPAARGVNVICSPSTTLVTFSSGLTDQIISSTSCGFGSTEAVKTTGVTGSSVI